MTQEKWDEVVERIKATSKVLRHEKEPNYKVVTNIDGSKESVQVGTQEELEFEGPLGKMKITRTERPKVEEQVIHAHRKTEGAQIESKYSDTEIVSEEKLYKFDDILDDWVEQEFKM